jgi:hypothetical protein
LPEKQSQLLYKIVIEVTDNGQFKMTCTKPDIHPASLIVVLSALAGQVAANVVNNERNKKIQLVDPLKLPRILKSQG